MEHYAVEQYRTEMNKLETEMKKQEPKKPTMMVIDPAETYPLYLRIVEMARGMANNYSLLTYEERFNAALIAVAFEHGKDSK